MLHTGGFTDPYFWKIYMILLNTFNFTSIFIHGFMPSCFFILLCRFKRSFFSSLLISGAVSFCRMIFVPTSSRLLIFGADFSRSLIFDVDPSCLLLSDKAPSLDCFAVLPRSEYI